MTILQDLREIRAIWTESWGMHVSTPQTVQTVGVESRDPVPLTAGLPITSQSLSQERVVQGP